MLTEEQLQAGFRLGEWDILPAKGLIRRGDVERRPEPQTWRVLFSLARRDGDLVTRDELIQDAWAGRATADDPINRAIAQLRKLLDDKSKPPEYVETLHRRGYRLIQAVVLHQHDVVAQDEAPPATIAKRRRFWPWFLPVFVIGSVAIVAIIAISTGLWPRPPVRSIAVLPFDNLGGVESDEYLVSGLKEVLVQTLHGIDDFTVKNGRVRYEKEDEEIAEILEVESVLGGSVRRKGDVLVINYRISKRGKGVVHSGDIEGTVAEQFKLQEKLAEMVRNELVGHSPQLLIKSRPTDSAAYDSYMRGMFALERRGVTGNLEQSIELFQGSIRLDRNYGPAYLALATAYALMVDYRDAPLEELNQLAIDTVEAGMAVDPSIGDAAGAVYGYVYQKEKRWEESEAAYRRAVSADVVDSNAFNWYSRMLASVGRLDEALQQALLAINIDPSSAIANSRVAIAYAWSNDAKRSNEYFKRANDLGASGETHLLAYALLLVREGQLQQAKEVTIVGMQLAGYQQEWIEPLFSALGDESKIPIALQAFERASAAGQLPPQVALTATAMLGDIDSAIRVAGTLESSQEFIESELLFIPELQLLRQHPDFLPLLQRLGITRYWNAAGCEWTDDRVSCDSM